MIEQNIFKNISSIKILILLILTIKYIINSNGVYNLHIINVSDNNIKL